MPIKGLTDQATLSFPKIGDIRKGAPKGKNRPGEDLDYFRVEFREGEDEAGTRFKAIYGDRPREINILLPFPDVERNWETWQEAYTAGALQHRCDGETCVLWRDQNGEIRHDPIPCPGGCTPVGRLKVIIPELRRLAYLVVHTTSKWDIIEITRNLQALRQLTGDGISGIPLVLKRRPRKVSVPTESGKRIRKAMWLLSIEADPRWVEQQIKAMKAAAMPALPSDEPEEPAPLPEVEIEGEFADDIGTSQVASNGNDVERPAPPEVVRKWLRKKAGWIKGEADDWSDARRRPDDELIAPDHKEVQRAAALIGKALDVGEIEQAEVDRRRHSVLIYIFGVDSTSLLDRQEVRAILSWIQSGPGSWEPDPVAAEECRRMFVARMEEKGQQRLL